MIPAEILARKKAPPLGMTNALASAPQNPLSPRPAPQPLASRGMPAFGPLGASPQMFAATRAAGVPKNPFSLVDAGGWAAPQKGEARYGSMFASGLGERQGNRVDNTQWGSGLWAAGYDPYDPNIGHKLWDWSSKDPGYNEKVGDYWKNNQKSGNARNDLVNSADWYYQDLARRMDKDNKFGSTTFGKILGTIGPLAAGFIPGIGPLTQAAIGAGIGGATNGVKGAILGGVGSLIGPSIKLPGGLGGALRAPGAAISSVAKQFSNPMTLGRAVASKGIGSFNNRG